MTFDYNNYDRAKEAAIDFINSEFLNGDIENLTTFSFWDFFDSNGNFKVAAQKYVQPEHQIPSKFDGDRIAIVYAIDRLFYQDKKIPDFDGNIGIKYTGDTINTFNTLFGNKYCRENGKTINRQDIVAKRYKFSPELIQKRDDFF